jgi:hypothetical protein
MPAIVYDLKPSADGCVSGGSTIGGSRESQGWIRRLSSVWGNTNEVRWEATEDVHDSFAGHGVWYEWIP